MDKPTNGMKVQKIFYELNLVKTGMKDFAHLVELRKECLEVVYSVANKQNISSISHLFLNSGDSGTRHKRVFVYCKP